MERRAFLQTAVATAAAVSLPHRPLFAVPRRLHHRIGLSDVEAVTGDGKAVTLSAKSIADLKAALRGRLLLAGDSGYDDARRILNPSFDKRPALVIQPTGAADIRTAVQYARDNGGLLLAVKCGGHSASGQSTCERGMQIDLSLFRDVRVDPVARRAWVTGGSLLGQVDHETMAHGLVTPLGTVSHTGVGGLVTGGGFGRVARRFGLAIDNLESIQVVTADGELRRASANENADLFWGVRGGGGNFGIVTSFEFRLHPMQRDVFAGVIVYPMARAREAFRVFAEYGPNVPDELDLGFVMTYPIDGAPPSVVFPLCYSGPADRLDAALAPLRKLGNPTADRVAAAPYVAVQRSGDVDDPRAMAVYLKSGFVKRIAEELIALHVERLKGHPARDTSLFFQQGGGAISRVPKDSTAFVQRDIHANMLCAVSWKSGSDPSEHVRWIKEYWEPVEKFTDGFYINDPDMEGSTPAAVRDAFASNHNRLVQVKNKYDPKNLFRLNTNVKPTV
jgi:FAD/FMN-containing dehydrogenase